MGGNSNDTLHLDFRRFSALPSPAQRSPAQRVSAQIKLLRRPGWLQLVVVPPPNGQYIPTVQYRAVQYSTTTVHPQVIVLPSLRWESLQISLFMGCHYSQF